MGNSSSTSQASANFRSSSIASRLAISQSLKDSQEIGHEIADAVRHPSITIRRSLAGVHEVSPLIKRDLMGEGEVVAGQEAPPLIIWIGPALVCALAYALYNIFIKKGSASINPVLGGVILQFVAALLGTVLLGILILKEGHEALHYDSTGIFWAILAGVAVGVAEMVSFCVSGMGVQATQSIPIIIGGSVMFGAVLGVLMLHEVLTAHGWIGVALLVTGIGLVATDPGPKVAGH